MSATALGRPVAGSKENARTNARRFDHGLALMCPACGTDLDAVLPWAPSRSAEGFVCGNCAFEVSPEQEFWNALPPVRQGYYERFMREYEIVRSSEGRGSDEASFYLALPHEDLTGRHSFQWKIRSRSFAYFEREILPTLERRRNRPLGILDLGAGNGWLSYRLSLRGHHCVAVDLLANDFDGLAAARHYSKALPWPLSCFRAEVDQLPFADGQMDCVIFNASFHYSEDYSRTLGEAIRCLRPGGTVAIVDSPWYSKEEYGAKMVQERREDFTKRFGFPSNGLASQEYLTDERLFTLAGQFGIHWTAHRPWYGLRWAARPWVAIWKGKREPADFRIYTAESRTS